MKLMEIMMQMQNWDISKIYYFMMYSSVSAQRLKCPSLARAGKFQLELITTIYTYLHASRRSRLPLLANIED